VGLVKKMFIACHPFELGNTHRFLRLRCCSVHLAHSCRLKQIALDALSTRILYFLGTVLQTDAESIVRQQKGELQTPETVSSLSR
jgi:hypothetical protein